MTYMLIAILATGQVYVELRNLSLASCAGRLALLRTETLPLFPIIGEVKYYCVPETLNAPR